MSELHKFIFDGLPVRGMLVRLTDSWQEILKRRESAGGYPAEVMQLLGEMTAAGALMQSNIKFNGALILQIFGDGPVKLAVAEVQPDLSLRATATVTGEVPEGSSLSQLVNVNNEGRCAITLDPKDKFPGQQPYQGVVPLFGDRHEKIEKLSEVLEHYMLQSEQLDTRLILAADGNVAAGLLIQRLPVKGQGNLEGQMDRQANEDQIGVNEDYQRIAMLAGTLKREELLDARCRYDPAPAVLGRTYHAFRAANAQLCLQLLARAGGQHAARPGHGGNRKHHCRARQGRCGLRVLRRAVRI